MPKIWVDGRVKINLNKENEDRVKTITEKSSPELKDIVELLKVIINILTE